MIDYSLRREYLVNNTIWWHTTLMDRQMESVCATGVVVRPFYFTAHKSTEI